jgi:hypothetical protein
MTGDAAFDARVRGAIVASIRDRGVIPTIAAAAAALQAPVADVDASFGRMAAAHEFIPRRGSNEIHAYDPFCAEATEFRVRSAGREWWAICGWDALGIPSALGEPGVIESSCPDCGSPLSIEVQGGIARAKEQIVLLVGVRAREFWKDIYFT